MRDQMRGEFLRYDQARMIEKFCLEANEDFIYLDFFARAYRIGRGSGIVEWSSDGFCTAEPADFNESMTIYDVLCCSKDDCRLSGVFCLPNSLQGAISTAGGSAVTGMYEREAALFDGKSEQLRQACRRLQGQEDGKGDVAFRIPVFSFLPLRFEFWEADEDFPPKIGLYWDENVLNYLHYETLWYAAGHLMRRLRKLLGAE